MPSTVEVTVTERVPMGVGRINGALYLVDRSGTVIDEFGPHYSDLDLPVIDGLVHGSSTEGIAVDILRADLAARLLDQLRYQHRATAGPDGFREVILRNLYHRLMFQIVMMRL